MGLSSSNAVGWGAVLVAAVALGVWAGGGAFLEQHARTSYDTGGLEVRRAGWDTLRPRLRFVRRTSLGPARPVQADTTVMHVFDAEYDTLYAGPVPAALPVPDLHLADREPLLVEACGTFRRGSAPGHTLCEQAVIRASPKRVRAEEAEVTFPEGDDLRRGRYAVRLRAERRAFRDTTWEPLPTSALGGVLTARVQSLGGQGTVQVPMDASGRGGFDLARHDGYDDFRYHLRASMERPGRAGQREAEQREGEAPSSATVAFEVRAGPNGTEPRVVRRLSKDVRRLTPTERRRWVEQFAESAAEKIVQRLDSDRAAERSEASQPEDRSLRATVRDWSYDRFRQRYTAEIRVRWRDREGLDDRYTLDGTLTVEGEQRRARFVGEEGNRRAARRWRRATEGDTLDLGTLDEPSPDEQPSVTAGLPGAGGDGEPPARGLADRRAGRHGR